MKGIVSLKFFCFEFVTMFISVNFLINKSFKIYFLKKIFPKWIFLIVPGKAGPKQWSPGWSPAVATTRRLENGWENVHSTSSCLQIFILPIYRKGQPQICLTYYRPFFAWFKHHWGLKGQWTGDFEIWVPIFFAKYAGPT